MNDVGTPCGWTSASLGELGTLFCGQSASAAEVNRARRGVPYVTGPEQWTGREIHVDKWTEHGRRLVPPGCVFITVKGAGVGKLFPGISCAIGRDVYAYLPGPALDGRFVEFALRVTINDVLRHARGDIAGLSKEHILGHVVALPPPMEQRRIVAKLEALQARNRRAREALDAVPPMLEKLRQSILAAAFRGDLTRDWRTMHKDVEPASKLLERVRADRRKRWAEAELAKMKARGKAPTDDKWKAKYQEPSRLDATGLPKLPVGWCWASLDELLLRIEAGRSPRAHGRPAEPGEEGVLKVSAVSWEEFDATENKALLEGEEIGDTPRVRAGDLLISRANTVQLVGAVVLVHEDSPNLMLSDKTLRLVPSSSAFPLELLLHALRTREVRALFEDDATGTSDSMRNLSQEKIRAAPIALPPSAEAEVIVRLLRVATRSRRSIDRRRNEIVTSLGQLEHAVLAKAFRGELVAQDPADEPAEAVLARLRGTNGRSENGSREKRGAKAAKPAAPRRVDSNRP